MCFGRSFDRRRVASPDVLDIMEGAQSEENSLAQCSQDLRVDSENVDETEVSCDILSHMGPKKTFERIKYSFFWEGLRADVKKFCESCKECHLTHTRTVWVKDRSSITPVARPALPFQVVNMDLIGLIDPPSAKGHKYILSLVYRHTRWGEAVPLTSLSAKGVPKEGRNDDQLFPTITLADANAVANYRLLPHRYKKPLIVDFDCSRNLTSIIARLRTSHFKGMKISSDKTRTYIPCKNCTEIQPTPDHFLECPALTPHIIRLGMVPLASELREVLYSADAPRLAEAVQRAHGII
ncbi:retrovirus-related Pol polyprotein from transposon opus [Trichonephila clavipes]|nr:retrovirus-related Pol polyprotein from transposon opus [Trichonephila clavipes]